MSFSLGGLVGGAAQGFTQEQQQALQQKLAQQQQAGQTAWGNALAGTPAQPQQNPLQALLAKFGVGGQPPIGLGGAPSMQQPQGGAPPSPMGGGLMPSVGGAPGAPQPQPQGGSPMPAQQPQAPTQPQGGAPSSGGFGPFTLENAIERIKQNNPGIAGANLAAAVNASLPAMNAQAQMQWKSIMAQLAPAKLQETVDQDKWKREHGDQTAAETAKRDAENADYKRDALKFRETEFNRRLAERVREYDTTLEANFTKLQATNDRAEAARLANEYRAAVNAKLRATQTEIQASNSLDPDQKAPLMAKASEDAEMATQRLDEATKAMKARMGSYPTGAEPNADGSKRTEKPPLSTRAPAEVVPGKEIKALPPDEIGKAKAAIKSGQISREDMVKALQEQGYDTSGL